jgi:ubiquitin-conjugating enzyme E2 D/E
MAQKRIQKELLTMQKDPLEEMELQSGEDLHSWQLLLKGTGEYAPGTYKLQLLFPQEFPFKPPQVKFLTRIYHPNIDQDGQICLQLLKPDKWKPSTSVRQLLLEIIALIHNPNPDDPLEPSIAQIYTQDRELYRKNVNEWIKRYASS